MKRYYVIFFLFSSVTLIAAILYFAIFFTTQETLTLVRQDIQEEWVGEGEVVAAGEVQVGFIGGGRVAQVNIKEGGGVRKDDVLAQLDVAEKEAELARYAAKIEVEKLKLFQLLSGVEKKEIALVESKIDATVAVLEHARKELEDAKTRAESELARQYALAIDYSDAVVLNAENAAHALLGVYDEQNKFRAIFIIEDSQKRSEAEWQIMLERTALENIKRAGRSMKEGLSRGEIDNTISNMKTNLEVMRAALQKTSEVLSSATMIFGAPDISGYRTTVAVQRSVVNATQTALLTLEQGIASSMMGGATAVRLAENKAAEAESTLHTLERELAVKKAFAANSAIALEQAQIKEYEADRETIRQQIADSVLRAPFDSVARRVYVRRGSAVLRDTVVALLAPLSDLQVDVVVPEGAKNIITVGDTVDIMWEDEKSKGIVVSVHDKGVTVHFGNEDLPPVVGTRVSVRIYTTLKKGALLVPKSFIEEENGTAYVYKEDGGEKRKTAVFTGMEWHGSRDVVEGVSEGDVLVRP
ncbi:MAG: biotin/lipoyl-binding protein [Patescibacteria group bacterium]